MALSQSVEASLKEAESNLRNALAYAARQERPVVCGVIADLISKIDNLQSVSDQCRYRAARAAKNICESWKSQ